MIIKFRKFAITNIIFFSPATTPNYKMNFKKLLLVPVFIISILFLIVLAIAMFPYIFTNVYKFPAMKPFSGVEWYNPYADTSGKWFKANFHAHAQAWGGLTNGTLTPEQVDSVYKSLGYDFAGISDYHKITKSKNVKDDEFIPLYEHGLNVWKRHQHPIGAKEIVNFDYPLFQSLHHKQDIIERIRPTTKLLAINHPEFLEGYHPDDFQYLSNYTHIEILNHYRTSVHHWDAALSAGYPAFGYGNDDSHNQTRKDETGRYWTMVRAGSLLGNLIVDALRKGNSVAVKGNNAELDNELRYLRVENDSMKLKLTMPADSILLIGNYGEVLGSFAKTDSLVYPLKKVKTYLRTEVYNPKTTFFLNPLIRTDGILPTYKPVKNAAFSFVVRIVGIAVYAFYLVFIFRVIRKIYRYLMNKAVIRII